MTGFKLALRFLPAMLASYREFSRALGNALQKLPGLRSRLSPKDKVQAVLCVHLCLDCSNIAQLPSVVHPAYVRGVSVSLGSPTNSSGRQLHQLIHWRALQLALHSIALDVLKNRAVSRRS